jgi:hypothetical protein
MIVMNARDIADLATAAQEQGEDAALRPSAFQMVRGLPSGRSLLISFFETTAQIA